ncbi:Nephrocystin-4 [Dissostichus eleginoides]|uniref:Nephrocystin-4 n=1 Tax=Dissostichus eleginoides TaxID=100907 RepID=A0AAD9FHP9_DISEL|nr:Nephrocystin-4 [Dissostichus eleginoides]
MIPIMEIKWYGNILYIKKALKNFTTCWRNRVLYFHTSLRLLSTVVVLELVSLSPRPDGSQQALGRGFTVLELFTNRPEAQAADGDRRPVIVLCTLEYTGDALLRPQLLKMLPFTLNKLTISLQPSLEKFESQLLQLINADCHNTGSIDVIKAELQAALSGQRELQAQIKEAHLAIHSYTATEEMLIAMTRETEETIKENVSLEKELKCLKERQNHLQVIKELYQLAKAEKQTVCQQNEALQQEVMDLCKKLEKESIVQNEIDAMNASINEGNRQTEILQMHIFELAQRLLRLEDLQTSYNIAMAEKESISQQNQFLQQKKGEFSRDLENEQTIKVKYETCIQQSPKA